MPASGSCLCSTKGAISGFPLRSNSISIAQRDLDSSTSFFAPVSLSSISRAGADSKQFNSGIVFGVRGMGSSSLLCASPGLPSCQGLVGTRESTSHQATVNIYPVVHPSFRSRWGCACYDESKLFTVLYSLSESPDLVHFPDRRCRTR